MAALAVVLLPVLTLTALRVIVEDKPEVHAFSFAPSTDWYVSAEAPDRAFNDRWLRTGNSTRHHAQTYLRFQVDGVTGDVSRVTLRVHAASANREASWLSPCRRTPGRGTPPPTGTRSRSDR